MSDVGYQAGLARNRRYANAIDPNVSAAMMPNETTADNPPAPPRASNAAIAAQVDPTMSRILSPQNDRAPKMLDYNTGFDQQPSVDDVGSYPKIFPPSRVDYAGQGTGLVSNTLAIAGHGFRDLFGMEQPEHDARLQDSIGHTLYNTAAGVYNFPHDLYKDAVTGSNYGVNPRGYTGSSADEIHNQDVALSGENLNRAVFGVAGALPIGGLAAGAARSGEGAAMARPISTAARADMETPKPFVVEPKPLHVETMEPWEQRMHGVLKYGDNDRVDGLYANGDAKAAALLGAARPHPTSDIPYMGHNGGPPLVDIHPGEITGVWAKNGDLNEMLGNYHGDISKVLDHMKGNLSDFEGSELANSKSHNYFKGLYDTAKRYEAGDPSVMAPQVQEPMDWNGSLWHGTKTDFDNFKASDGGAFGSGVYGTPDKGLAKQYGEAASGPDPRRLANFSYRGQLMPEDAYLTLQHRVAEAFRVEPNHPSVAALVHGEMEKHRYTGVQTFQGGDRAATIFDPHNTRINTSTLYANGDEKAALASGSTKEQPTDPIIEAILARRAQGNARAVNP